MREPAHTLPVVEIIEEGMREGMQIESESISVDAKLRLLDALSVTGLGTIVVGSFVSPRWTPQMAWIDELVGRMTPHPGVTYTGLALNERGRERMRAHMPPLAEPAIAGRTMVHLCDVFARRNTNRSQEQEIALWPSIVERAVEAGAARATVGVNAAWGSNWTGDVPAGLRMEMLERQRRVWSAAGIPVDRVWLGDPMGWNTPWTVGEQLTEITQTWPEVTTVHLHLHNARGSALASIHEAVRVLDARHRLVLDTAIGGMGGCPYSGHGQMTRMAPTEDVVDLLHERGIDTGVDLALLIEAAHVAEEVVGHALWGHVSKVGPRPRGDALFAMDMPMVQTERQAQHFRLGEQVYEGALRPWNEPIQSPARPVLTSTERS
ncbi:citramalate synthase [Pseudonocardia oroxyli]|uniref:Hydroxymethylglutaryl-CoA lyase n=1 Tax=Pseudonocardia oroxyli TaxID=366584 RepID=A0A1G7SNS4_PSEOR|nr:citramalate synthase [Pseudonocardia oroxyli]SDG24715.1 hydroxymethylglutaryl-CoA lyase [Pseudonocardia oroxyli]